MSIRLYLEDMRAASSQVHTKTSLTYNLKLRDHYGHTLGQEKCMSFGPRLHRLEKCSSPAQLEKRGTELKMSRALPVLLHRWNSSQTFHVHGCGIFLSDAQ